MKYFALLAGLVGLTAGASTPNRIGQLAGCFSVSYRFVEDGAHDYEIARALEWITVKYEGNEVHTVQHYGLDGDDIMKHFYETWTYTPATQNWQQQVFGPSGNFRYTCESADRMGQFRCISTGAPKPLRDHGRRDYDLLNRGTTVQITPAGWVQNEINDKVKKDGTVVATEVGWIEYRRLPNLKVCLAAKEAYPQE